MRRYGDIFFFFLFALRFPPPSPCVSHLTRLFCFLLALSHFGALYSVFRLLPSLLFYYYFARFFSGRLCSPSLPRPSPPRAPLSTVSATRTTTARMANECVSCSHLPIFCSCVSQDFDAVLATSVLRLPCACADGFSSHSRQVRATDRERMRRMPLPLSALDEVAEVACANEQRRRQKRGRA